MHSMHRHARIMLLAVWKKRHRIYQVHLCCVLSAGSDLHVPQEETPSDDQATAWMNHVLETKCQKSFISEANEHDEDRP